MGQSSLDFVRPPPPSDPALSAFHPVIQRWFVERLGEPTEPQRNGWPALAAQRDVLIAAPTGSGKTLAAFLSALDKLFRRALAQELPSQTSVLYVSPLKALGNDVQKNLREPLGEISALAKSMGLNPLPIDVQVRTGDTKPSDRAGMVRRPPHILITTPESLYLYLTSRRARETLRSVETVIVDEIHALARDKRGSHLSLSLERLKVVTRTRPQLIGLSATQRPVEEMAAFLLGSREAPCDIIQSGHVRPWDLSIEVPDEELSAVATHEMWGQVYDRLVRLSEEHRTTLIFTNTRRLAERVAHDLGERIGKERVAAHHGSMSKEMRLSAEERLKEGTLKVMCATASLELGIDIGHVDLVVQLGTPRAIATCLQRVGRANHHKAGISKGILFALTRDELVECTALLRAVHEGILDTIWMPKKPQDILAQQVTAACAVDSWDERELFTVFRRAYPYRELTAEEFDKTLTMLSDGVATGRGRMRAYLHRDRVNHRIKARRGAHITALTNGGAIPDTFNLPVIAEPEGKQVGTLDEDFAIDSMAGDVFLLGSTSWRIQSVRAGAVYVEDAKGQAPTVPFWRGEAPSRTPELSFEVGRLRRDVLGMELPMSFLEERLGLTAAAADQLVRYLRAAEHALGEVPTTETVVAERFFDEAGGMQLIIHAPFGGRVNRAWGMALRKRFCRSFDFELQAAATDDGLLLSLGEQHSFPLVDIFDFLHPNTVEEVLLQAVLQAPLFETRFRWNATRALALLRFNKGQRVPPQLQRARAEDLLAAVFPAQVGCQDNHGGEAIEPPDHPIVNETVDNCLREALDIDGLKAVLLGLKDGRIRTVARDLPEPSPLAHALLNSQPYTFLDDAPAEERRTRAVSARRTLSAEDASGLGALDVDAINQVTADARPLTRDEDELHEALLQLVLMPEDGIPAPLLDALIAKGRAARLTVGERTFAVSAERLQLVRALDLGGRLEPALEPLPEDLPVEREAAVLLLVRGRMEVAGPLTAHALSLGLGLPESEVEQALFKLESEGQVLRGAFRPGGPKGQAEWCDRRLLQRIHRMTVARLRKEIEPLSGADFMRFLFRWHHLDTPERPLGPRGMLRAVELLEGFEAPAAAWEHSLFPLRVKDYSPELLERVCFGGDVMWGRITLRGPRSLPGPKRGATVAPVLGQPARRARGAIPARNTALSFVRRTSLDWMLAATRRGAFEPDGGAKLPEELSPKAVAVAQALQRRGASFFTELQGGSGLSSEESEAALWELLTQGLVTADAVENLRVLQSLKKRRRQTSSRPGGRGRWSLLAPLSLPSGQEVVDAQARLFLTRYGVVFRDLVQREPLAPSWRELVAVYRRMEARGEIRGGRFVAAFAGEQFALPSAVEAARAVRRTPGNGAIVRVAAVDPLNLTGVVTPGARVPAVMGQWVTYVDGVPEGPPAEAERASGEEAAA
jgi:ATP-dependent Lhr-like helicase